MRSAPRASEMVEMRWMALRRSVTSSERSSSTRGRARQSRLRVLE